MNSSDDIQFSWNDLIVDNITQEEATAWLAEWHWLDLGQIAPIFISRFGDWFFQRPNGTVHMLSVERANVEPIAPDLPSFKAIVNTQNWQEQFLYSALLMKYRRHGIIAQGRQVIGFAPHPALVDSLDKCKVIVFNMIVWQTICSQTMRQVLERK